MIAVIAPAVAVLLAGLVAVWWRKVEQHREQHRDKYNDEIKGRLAAATWARQSSADPFHAYDPNDPVQREAAAEAMRQWNELTQETRENREP